MTDWQTILTQTSAAERAAFANGRESLRPEIEGYRAALITILAILNSSARYKARDARRIARTALAEPPLSD